MTYAALLRGINVGGNSKVDMKKLKHSFESLGFDPVVTYINSGNVIFKTDLDDLKLITGKIEAKILVDFGFPVKILARSQVDFENICKSAPANWINNDEMKCDVLFLWDEMHNSDTVKMLNLVPNVDTAIYQSGAIIWSVDRENYNKSAMQKFIKTPVYPKMTTRNINTTRKILEIMLSIS
jgi:uncharacterized protein (DUF1697 family)